MGASSKKKGKQRKAAARKASLSTDTSTSANGGVSSSSISGAGVSSAGVSSAGINKIVAKVRSGDNKVTKKLLNASSGLLGKHSGVLSAVLGFLNRCEDETFDQVMNSVGGDLKTPSLWLSIIVNANFDEPSCKLQIAESIGPLVRCFCNDTDRLFFKSNKHWREGIAVFADLVSMLREMLFNVDRGFVEMKTIDTLLHYDGSLSSIIQWTFWREYRSDIVKELGVDSCVQIESIGRDIIVLLMRDALDGKGKERMQTIGTTPIVCKDYDPNCSTSFAEGLAHQLQAGRGSENDYKTLIILVEEAGCVDKGVIREVINLANVSFDYTHAEHLSRISFSMLLKKSMEPCDTRIAFAIRQGLVEMCLGFIESFGELHHDSFLIKNIERSFSNIHTIILHHKTAKAIRSKRQQIEDKLLRLEQNTNITNTKCKKLLDMVSSALAINGSYSYCCRCNKSLTRTEVMECNGCHRMTYCSRACQREDWLNGHSVTCCKSYTDATSGQFQGRLIPPIEQPENQRASTKLKELETNLNTIQQKLFLDNAEDILNRAKELNLPLYDCVVTFDIRRCFSRVKVEKYTDHYTPKAAKGFRKTRSKENITCIYYSPLYYGDVQPGEYQLYQQRLFPHQWLLVKRKT